MVSQCLLAAVNRDCLSGWGGIVHVMCAPLFTRGSSLDLTCTSLPRKRADLSLCYGCSSKDQTITRTLKGRMD